MNRRTPSPSHGKGPIRTYASLRKLAQLYGVQASYYDVAGRLQQASPESILMVLPQLGAPIGKIEDVSDALEHRRRTLSERILQPVNVVWEGDPVVLKLSLPDRINKKTLGLQLELEDGAREKKSFKVSDLPTLETTEVGRERYVVRVITLPSGLPWGYHQVTLDVGNRRCESLLLAAPKKAYAGGPDKVNKTWGVFLPLYSLHSKRSWGAGDFSDMETLYEWVRELGGELVATLPFLASFLSEPFEPSPYAPASRLFWNEFYLDLRRIPELQKCPAAMASLESIEADELSDLRSSPTVDYRKQMLLKRRVIEQLAHCFFEESSERRELFQEFLKSNPAVEDYARFRATGEKQRLPWPQWPEPLRDGVLGPGDHDQRAVHYHLYSQWLARDQIRAMAAVAREIGPGLYLDLPLGVHPSSYDTWRERGAFPEKVSGGAPPDAVFTNGQDWGFPPLHPEKIREERYGYVVNFLRHIMQQAGVLRIDHVMGLHRIFWIPRGVDASQGVYVRYPAEELYAILSIESHRNRCQVVGENLGTVPSYVNKSMGRHNVLKMYVVQYEIESRHPQVLKKIPSGSVASLNTHDMYPFAGFLKGVDIKDRNELGLLNKSEAREEQKNRRAAVKDLENLLASQGELQGPSHEAALLKSSLNYLSASPARVVLVNLEDLWLDVEPQNVPGTTGERPNWRRKARHTLEEIQEMEEVMSILKGMDRIRKGKSMENKKRRE